VTYLAEPGENNVFSTRATSTPGDDVISNVRVIFDEVGDRRGRDVYMGAAPSPDDVSLVPRAELDYSSRTLPVHLDLRPGHPSEDRVSAIPKILGSRVADLLIGDDTLDGGFLGGRVRCGPGRDAVIAEPRAHVGSDCELIQYEADSGARQRLRLRLRLPRVGASFLSGIEACGCKRPERWRVKARGLTVSSLRPGKHRSALRLDAAGQRLLRRSGSLPVRVDLRTRTFYKQVRDVRFRLVLHLL
jgi:hypothetical protein